MNKIVGLVEVYSINGEKVEKIYEDQNQITVGLGYSIANLMTSNQEELSDNYTVGYASFGFGAASTSPVADASSYLFQLIKPVNVRFLNNNITADVSELFYLTGTTYVTSSDIIKSETTFPFIHLPKSRISDVSVNAVRHTILLDDSFDQEYAIKEIGLFIRNPELSFILDEPIMAAYKKFDSIINKPIGVKLKIDWTFRFNI